MPSIRKRGKELERAILEAAFEIFQTSGYQEMTFQNVAKKAKTSRTVLYRQYVTQINLLHEMAHYRISQVFGELTILDLIEDRGSLRSDLQAMASIYQRFLVAVGPELFSAVMLELSRKQDILKEMSIHAQEVSAQIMQKIQDFAKKRGELTCDLTTMQVQLPFNMMRYEYIIQGGNLTESYLSHLVDEVLLPIYLNNKSLNNFQRAGQV
ncbi:TetR/AcrR family transcriptional regulator [Paenibacillus sp. OV219]|uniref:TetR/AcrR family transcriptional regulator n=1 Tax=Paenibacillus sp. OV219 TaxID=1884377 RepID=UPI0008B490DD|nr:TetR/AcrR family transcriptional regulator [Paenibacillus sp. OV219]SEN49391.1 transcriptional regulator, TetR family [Paenibacillus sp. OV219]